jgi:hypothetical protein
LFQRYLFIPVFFEIFNLLILYADCAAHADDDAVGVCTGLCREPDANGAMFAVPIHVKVTFQ